MNVISNYVEVPITTSEEQIKEEALTKLQEKLEEKGVVGYSPDPAALEIIALETLAGMAQNANISASTVLNAIFTQFGIQFVKLAFNEGAYATGKTTWTITPAVTVRHIEAGITIEAGGQGFEVEVETEVKANAVSVELQVKAVERGVEGNKISGIAQQVNPLTYVTEVVFVGETSGGTEEETSEEYRSRLVAAIALQAPRPITSANYAEMTLLIPETYIGGSRAAIGTIIGRATAIDGYAAESAGKGKGNTKIEAKTNSSTTLTEVSIFTGVSLESTSLPQKHPGSELHWEACAGRRSIAPLSPFLFRQCASAESPRAGGLSRH